MASTRLTQVAAAMPALGRRRPQFEAWLSSRAPKDTWTELNLEDLGLCWLALQKDSGALLEVDRRLQRVAKPATAKKGDEHFLEEVLQRVRQRLFVGEKPRLAAYQGRGALVQYLKAVVLSVSVDLLRASGSREEATEDEVLMAAATGEDGADARLAHQAHRQHFTAAFKEALQALEPEERTWLRMRFVEGMAIEAIGAAFGVHRTTAMRRLEKAQELLVAETRKVLAKKLKLPPRELDSLLKAMRPSLAENLSRLLPKLG